MRRAATPLAALLLTAALSGCMALVCGPTVYHLSGVTARYAAEGAWDTARLRAAFEEAGLRPRAESEFSLSAGDENLSVTAYRRDRGPHELSVSFAARASGSQGDVDRAADARVAEVEAEAARLSEAIARVAGWSLASTQPRWDKGTLHGDC